MSEQGVNADLMNKANVAIANTKDPVKKVQAKLLARGASSMKGFSRFFRIIDSDDNNQISKEEFIRGLHLMDVQVTDEEVGSLFQQLDKDGSGTINVTEFVFFIRPEMKKVRKDKVLKCFAKMDTTGDGVITIEDLAKTYKVNKHPKFLSGELTENQILKNFLRTFEAKDHIDGKVTVDEFISYYACLSATIDNDGFFDLMMTNAWGE